VKFVKINDVIYGNSYADMINKAIGTNYRGIQRCLINLDQFGTQGISAWFVFMNGSVNGYGEEWKWTNRLSSNGKHIIETCVSYDKNIMMRTRDKTGYYPIRLGYMLDPYESGNRHSCKFVGVFRIDCFNREDLTSVRYVKIADSCMLGDPGTFSDTLYKDKLLRDWDEYHTLIGSLGFSQETLDFLKKGDIKIAGELLDLGIESAGAKVDEIRKKIYENFGINDESNI
jgi:hypothetical protein